MASKTTATPSAARPTSPTDKALATETSSSSSVTMTPQGSLSAAPKESVTAMLKAGGSSVLATGRSAPRGPTPDISAKYKTQIVCPTGYSYDRSHMRCAEDVQTVQEVTEYKLQLLIHNATLVGREQIFRGRKEWKKLARAFKQFAKGMVTLAKVLKFSYSVGAFKQKPKWWEQRNSSAFPIYFSVEMLGDVNDTNRKEYSRNVLRYLGDQIRITMKGKQIQFGFILFNGTYEIEKEIKLFVDPDSGKCCLPKNKAMAKYEDKRVIVTNEELVYYETVCPYYELTHQDDYELDDGDMRLVFANREQKSPIVDAKYTFHGNDMITICTDIYNKYFIEMWALKGRTGDTKWTVIIVCVSLSLICLFLAFLTYCMFPSLRTIAAKNNMSLIFCLFMSQLVYVTGFRKTEDKILCQMIGVTLHYFWLASIFWMNVCCFHVFKRFVLSKTTSESRGSFVIISRYILYASGLPVIIVCAVVTIHKILTEGQESGYGGNFCFVSNVLVNGLTVALPLCLILLFNFLFFSATIFTINKTKQVRRSTGGERKNLWIYIKLSSITGLFAVFAIADAALHIEALSYISIVLNSGHGVFIFISYCCKKQILVLWKEKLTYGREKHSDNAV